MKLDVYQSLWAMELRRPDGRERSLEESFEMVATAGFDGMSIDFGATDMATAYKAKPLFEKYQLGCLFTAFPKTIEQLRPVLRMAREFGAPFVNVIGQVMPISVEATVPVVRRWIEMAEQEQVEIQFETHRNSVTNDMFAMLQLLDAVPEMVISADLSHYVVGREFDYPVSAAAQEHIARILRRAGSLQGRIASRQQIQVPFGFPQYRKWLDVFLAWWEQGFRDWRRRAPATARLNFLCELGPHEYAMTGPDGYELSDRWDEALILRDHARAIWARLDAEASAASESDRPVGS
ncbi:MAG TPA: sugar phosphate isomerase/epimerase [Stellaceae bacterium]|nr:sugar phosphate isomerase/epimerase [Stellaceae bacterium]